MNQPDAITVQKYLSGVDYPCGRDGLVEHARKQGADDQLLRELQDMPDREYDGPNAVSAQFSKSS